MLLTFVIVFGHLVVPCLPIIPVVNALCAVSIFQIASMSRRFTSVNQADSTVSRRYGGTV